MANELEFLQTLPDKQKESQQNFSVPEEVSAIGPETQETRLLPDQFLDTLPDKDGVLTKTYQNLPDQDPDKTAKIRQVSREIDEPELFVQENLSEIEESAKKPTDEDWQEVQNNSPETSEWLKDESNMAVAHDDVKSLSKNESIFDELKFAFKLMVDPSEKIKIANDMAKGQVPAVKSGFTSGVLQVKQSELGWKQMTNALITGKHSGVGDTELMDIEKRLAEHAEKEPGFNPFYFASQQIPNMLLMGRKAAERGALGGIVFGLGAAAIGQAGPQVLTPEEVVTVPAATATGLHVGGRLGALEAAAILEGGSAYRDFIKLTDKNGNKINPRRAAEMALLVGVTNAGLEYVSMRALLKTIPGGDRILKYFAKDKRLMAGLSPGQAVRNAAKNYLINIGTEVSTEIGQETVTGIGREILKKLDPKLVFDKFNIQSFLSDISRVISPAAQASLLLGAPGTVVTMAKESNKMAKTDLNKQVYESLGENADNAKLPERDKEAYADHVNKLSETSDVTEVFIGVEAFQQQSANIGLDPLQLAVELEIDDLYQDALNNDSDLAIPTGDWVAKTKRLEKEIGQPIYSSFADDVKFKKDEYTKREQREIGEFYQDQFKAEADRLSENDQEISDAREKIKDQTLKELLDAGTKKQVAEAQATLYADMVVATTGRTKDATVDEVSDGMIKEIIGVEEITKPADDLAQFAGLKSMTADNAKLSAAIQRLDAGEDANAIRKETGWFKGKDGKYRYEISDDQASFTFYEKGPLPSDIIFKSARARLKLADIIKHDELYRAYPFLENIAVNYNPNLKEFEGITAYYHPGSKTLNLSPDAIKNKQAIMHEIQHAIQDYEGFDGAFAIGAIVKTKEDIEQLEQSVSDMAEAFEAMKDYHDPQRNEDIGIYQRMGFINKYNRDKAILDQVKNPKPSGEFEAGVTGERAELTPEQRLEQAPAIMVYNGKEIPVKTQELFQEQLAPQTPEFKRFFKGSKVKDENGNPLVVYYGSGTAIEQFSFDFTNQGNDQLGSGFYFTTDITEAEGYTGRQLDPDTPKLGGTDKPTVVSAYLSIKKPLPVDHETKITEFAINRFIQKSPVREEALQNWGDVEFEGEASVVQAAIEGYASNEKTNLLKTLFDIANDFYPEPGHIEQFNKLVKQLYGFDGVVAEYGDRKHYVAFFPNQIKSTENVGTFDPSDPRILYQSKYDEILARQRQLEGLRAAIKDPETGKVYVGSSHQAAIESLPTFKSPGYEEGVFGRLSDEWDRETNNVGFVDNEGNFISRTEAEKRFDVLTMEDVRDKRRGLFQQKGQPLGSYNPTTRRVILAAKSANASTFVHEMGHAWLKFTHDMDKEGRLSDNYKKDWDVLKQWLDLKDDQTELTTAQQEKFARGFEAYLQEGKAPKVDLIGVFNKFKRWLMRVYESITHPSHGLINKSEIAEDVKGVMARMFATDEEIKASEYYLNYDKELDIAGIDPKVKEKLTKFKEDAHEKAFSKLLSEQMAEISNERKQEINTKRLELTTQFEESIRSSSLYRAIEALNAWKKPGDFETIETGPVQPGKKYRELSSVKNLAEKYAANKLDETRADMFNLVAESFEFYSGEDMANQIINKKPLRNEVDGLVDQEISQLYPDLMDSEEIREKAIEALHGDKQLEVMAMERDILFSMVEDAQASAEAQRYSATKAWLEADIARQKAENYLSGLKVNKVSRISKYITAERVNAVKALKAIKNKDFSSAAQYKQAQMINHALALGVIKLQKKKANIDRQLQKIVRRKKDLYNDQENYDQVQNILRRFGLNIYEVTPTKPLSDYLKELEASYMSMDEEATPVDVAEWLLDDSKESAVGDLTINQFQELLNSLKNMIHVSNSINKFYRMAKQQNIIATVEQLADVASKNLKPRKRPRAIRTKFEHLKNNVDDYLYSLEQIDTVLGRLDGWVDFGPWQTTISNEVKNAANFESDMRFKAKDMLKNIWSAYSKKEIDDIFKKKINVPQFGVDNENPITKQQLMAMALNLGNETNRDRLFDTVPVGFYPEFNWSRDNRTEGEAIILSILEEHLTEKDWNTIQNIWDGINSYWADIAKLHREITGFEPVKVEALPFEITLADGKRKAMKGGYYPLVGDPRYNEQIAVRELTGQPLYEENNPAHKAMTRTGHTKTRTNAKYAVSLNLDIINRHLNDVIHDLAFRPLIYDLRRLVSNMGFVDTVKKYTGDGGYRYIKQWIGAVAAGGNTEKFATDQLSRFVRWANNRQTFVIVLGRVSILAQNFANIFLAPNRVKGFGFTDTIKGYIGRGLFDYWPKATLNWKKAAEMRDWIWQRSTFMRDRRENPEYTLQDFKGVNVTDKAKFGEFLIGLIAGTDDVTNIPLWIEAYTKKLNETNNEQEAVKYADLLVYRIVGSGRKYDMAKIIRGTDVEKIFTKFYSFWNVEHNNWVRELSRQGKNPIANTPRFLGFVASRAIFIYVSAVLANQIPGEDETDERRFAEILKQYLTYPVSFFPFAREIGSIAVDSVLGLPTFGYRPSPAASLVTDLGRTVGRVGKAVRGGGQIQDVMEGITKMTSFAFRVPYQVDTWFWNAYDYITNGMEPAFGDLYRRRPKKKR